MDQELSQTSDLTILVIGKTGCGKTTLINMFMNLAQNKHYKDDRIIAITQSYSFIGQGIIQPCNIPEYMNKQSDKLGDGTVSQTSICNCYKIDMGSQTITFIDTPGLGDTEGVETDKQHIKNIVSEVQQFGAINSIIYVHKSSDNRKDFYLNYYIHEFQQMMTEGYRENFQVVFTNTINDQKIDALPVLQEMNINCHNFVFFENDCLIPLNMLHFESPQKKQNYALLSEFLWNQNQQQYAQMISQIAQLTPKDTKDLLRLLAQKECIIKIISEKQIQVKLNTEKQRELQRLNDDYQKEKEKISKISPDQLKTTIPKVVEKFKLVPTKKMESFTLREKVTYCYYCIKICHDECNLDTIYDKGDINITRCVAFEGYSICLVCGHNVELHGHTKEIIKEVDINVQVKYSEVEYQEVENLDMITQQNSIKQCIEQIGKMIDEEQKELKIVQEQINQDLRLIAILYQDIKNKAQRPQNDYTIEYLNHQIKQLRDNSSTNSEYLSKVEQQHNTQNS